MDSILKSAETTVSVPAFVSQVNFDRQTLCLLFCLSWIIMLEGPEWGELSLQWGPTQGSTNKTLLLHQLAVASSSGKGHKESERLPDNKKSHDDC